MIPRHHVAVCGLAVAGLAMGCAARSGGRVVARSRLGPVTAAELDRFLERRASAGQGADPSQRRARLEELLVRRALEREAEQSGLLLDPSAADELRRRSDALLVEEVRAQLAADPPPPVSDAQVDDAYARSSYAAPPVERLRLRHIFKRLSRAADAPERARVEREMEAIRAELDAGADFRSLARTRSDSQTASFDGLMAPVARGDLDSVLENVLWRLAPGERTGIVRTSAGLQIFLLEARETPPAVAAGDAKRVIRTRLERVARDEHVRAQLTALAKAHGADVHTGALEDPDAPDEAAAFDLPGWRLTLGDLRRRWRERPFVARRTSTLRAVLEAEAADRLLLEQARRERLEAQPATATRLDELRREYAVEVAARRHAAALASSPSEAELRELYEQQRARFDAPESRRLRGIVIPLDDPRAANDTYDSLDRLARRIRAGEDELAAAARRLSRDPSRADGGELGWAEARELAVWGGSSLSAGIFRLAPGEISAPLLVEAYDDARLVHVPRAYLLARVEEIRPAGPLPYADARVQVARLHESLRAAEVAQRVRKEVLASIGAVVLERP